MFILPTNSRIKSIIKSLNMSNLLDTIFNNMCLIWVYPKITPETKSCMQVVNSGSAPRKCCFGWHGREMKKGRERAKRNFSRKLPLRAAGTCLPWGVWETRQNVPVSRVRRAGVFIHHLPSVTGCNCSRGHGFPAVPRESSLRGWGGS